MAVIAEADLELLWNAFGNLRLAVAETRLEVAALSAALQKSGVLPPEALASARAEVMATLNEAVAPDLYAELKNMVESQQRDDEVARRFEVLKHYQGPKQ